VALIVGGLRGSSVEVYSPEGKCQHLLSDIPIEATYFKQPVLAFVDNKIIACAGDSDGTGTVNLKKYIKCSVRSYYFRQCGVSLNILLKFICISEAN
jgi:hypothetical protein